MFLKPFIHSFNFNLQFHRRPSKNQIYSSNKLVKIFLVDKNFASICNPRLPIEKHEKSLVMKSSKWKSYVQISSDSVSSVYDYG